MIQKAQLEKMGELILKSYIERVWNSGAFSCPGKGERARQGVGASCRLVGGGKGFKEEVTSLNPVVPVWSVGP